MKKVSNPNYLRLTGGIVGGFTLGANFAMVIISSRAPPPIGQAVTTIGLVSPFITAIGFVSALIMIALAYKSEADKDREADHDGD